MTDSVKSLKTDLNNKEFNKLKTFFMCLFYLSVELLSVPNIYFLYYTNTSMLISLQVLFCMPDFILILNCYSSSPICLSKLEADKLEDPLCVVCFLLADVSLQVSLPEIKFAY